MTGGLRAGVVGLGYFGKFHAKHYAAHPDATLAALVDIDESRAKAAAKQYGGEALTDYRDLIGRVDLVSVAVPTSLHFEVGHALLSAGIHVLVEKPITDTVERAEALIDCARERGLVLQVGHIERFSAVYRALAAKVTKPLYIEATRISPFRPRATDVDVVLDLMIHDIDIILGLAASKIVSVHAVGVPVLNPGEDIANARIEFASGAVANVTASRVAETTERRMRVFQPDSYVVCDFDSSSIVLHRRIGDPARQGAAAVAAKSWNISKEDSLFNEISEFLDCVRSGRVPTVDGRVGRDALRVANMITETLRAHRRRIEAELVV
ncbi:MAG: Gfo/Idh/MocA family oxidoreductase [Hyphomicrobiales bacterium]|nr:Gfo/Idh/MocA family oxidoreductase [Hyphomicrobiales bacterium]